MDLPNSKVYFADVAFDLRNEYQNTCFRVMLPNLKGSDVKVLTWIITRSLGWNKQGFAVLTGEFESGRDGISGAGVTYGSALKSIKRLADMGLIFTHVNYKNWRFIWVNLAFDPTRWMSNTLFNIGDEVHRYLKRVSEWGLESLTETYSAIRYLWTLTKENAKEVFMRPRKVDQTEKPNRGSAYDRDAVATPDVAPATIPTRTPRKRPQQSTTKPLADVAVLTGRVATIPDDATQPDAPEQVFNFTSHTINTDVPEVDDVDTDDDDYVTTITSLMDWDDRVAVYGRGEVVACIAIHEKRMQAEKNQRIEQARIDAEQAAIEEAASLNASGELDMPSLFNTHNATVEKPFKISVPKAEAAFAEGIVSLYGKDYAVVAWGKQQRGQAKHIINKLEGVTDADKLDFFEWSASHWALVVNNYMAWMKGAYIRVPAVGTLLKHLPVFAKAWNERTLALTVSETPEQSALFDRQMERRGKTSDTGVGKKQAVQTDSFGHTAPVASQQAVDSDGRRLSPKAVMAEIRKTVEYFITHPAQLDQTSLEFLSLPNWAQEKVLDSASRHYWRTAKTALETSGEITDDVVALTRNAPPEKREFKTWEQLAAEDLAAKRNSIN